MLAYFWISTVIDLNWSNPADKLLDDGDDQRQRIAQQEHHYNHDHGDGVVRIVVGQGPSFTNNQKIE